VTFANGKRGGVVCTALGYEREDGTVVLTHCWEGRTLNARAIDGKEISFDQCRLREPIECRQSTYDILPALRSIPVYRADRSVEISQDTQVLEWKGLTAHIPPSATAQGGNPSNTVYITYRNPARLDGGLCTVLAVEKPDGKLVILHSWEGDRSARGVDGELIGWNESALSPPVQCTRAELTKKLTVIPILNKQRVMTQAPAPVVTTPPTPQPQPLTSNILPFDPLGGSGGPFNPALFFGTDFPAPLWTPVAPLSEPGKGPK